MRLGTESGARAGTAPTAEEINRSVADITGEVVERDDIDPAVDLFDQGATSLAYIRIVAEINERYDIELDVAELEEASVDAMSALVRTQVLGATDRYAEPTPTAVVAGR